jgi:hypothetical protein
MGKNMHIIVKHFLTVFGTIAILLDIFAISFGLSYHYAMQGEDVDNNSLKINVIYELAQKNHHDLIIIKHILGTENAVD